MIATLSECAGVPGIFRRSADQKDTFRMNREFCMVMPLPRILRGRGSSINPAAACCSLPLQFPMNRLVQSGNQYTVRLISPGENPDFSQPADVFLIHQAHSGRLRG